jgi:hypothetical protein
MSAERFAGWIDRYENAWRTAGTEPLRDLLSAGATYLPALCTAFEEWPFHPGRSRVAPR